MSFMLLLLSLMSTSVTSQASSRDAPSPRKSDLVVVGVIERQKFVGMTDELGMNSVIEARVRVRRIEKGHLRSSVLTVRYIAHTAYSRDNLEHRFRLLSTADGKYLVCSEGGRGFVCP